MKLADLQRTNSQSSSLFVVIHISLPLDEYNCLINIIIRVRSLSNTSFSLNIAMKGSENWPNALEGLRTGSLCVNGQQSSVCGGSWQACCMIDTPR